MKLIYKLIPLALVGLFVIEMVFVLKPKRDGEFHVREFGRLPALMNGRVQPFDSVARNTLLQIRGTGDVPLELLPSWQFWRHPKNCARQNGCWKCFAGLKRPTSVPSS
jgi:hypothetical protein